MKTHINAKTCRGLFTAAVCCKVRPRGPSPGEEAWPGSLCPPSSTGSCQKMYQGVLQDKQCGLASPPQVPVVPGPHQNLQTTWMSSDGSIHCRTSYCGMLLSNKNPAITDIHNIVGGSPWNYAERKSQALKVTYDRSVAMQYRWVVVRRWEQKGGGAVATES